MTLVYLSKEKRRGKEREGEGERKKEGGGEREEGRVIDTFLQVNEEFVKLYI